MGNCLGSAPILSFWDSNLPDDRAGSGDQAAAGKQRQGKRGPTTESEPLHLSVLLPKGSRDNGGVLGKALPGLGDISRAKGMLAPPHMEARAGRRKQSPGQGTKLNCDSKSLTRPFEWGVGLVGTGEQQ